MRRVDKSRAGEGKKPATAWTSLRWLVDAFSIGVIGHCQFADGAMRPIYDDGQRQHVIDDDGYPAFGVWLIPEEEPAPPLIVLAAPGRPS